MIRGAVDTLTRWSSNYAAMSTKRNGKAQALLETSAAVIGGLIKAFNDYKRSGL
jgi:hypothetical protein